MRWKISTSTTIGTVTITVAAMICPQGTSKPLPVEPEKLKIATGTVRTSGVWVTQYAYDGQTHQLVVNGQSGEVHGSVPRGRLQQLLASLEGV